MRAVVTMLCFVSTNKGKFEVIRRVLKQYGVELEQKAMELTEPESDSLKEIALVKARQAFEIVKAPLIVEDTGFFLEAYPGFPGQHSKWVFNKIGYEGLFKLLEGKTRKASFHSVICFIDKNGYRLFEGKCRGAVTESVSEKISPELVYARIFTLEGEKVPSVAITAEENDKKSQRGKAAHALGRWLKENGMNQAAGSA